MNDIQASHRPVYGGYIGIIRRVHKAAFEPVCGKPGVPQIFATWWEAELAAHRALLRHVRGDLLRWGDKVALGARAEAEKLFSDNDLLHSGKRIPVLRK